MLVDRRTKIFHVRGSDERLLVAHRPRNSHRDRNDIVTTATADSWRARTQSRVHARLRTTPFTPKRRAIAGQLWLSLLNPGPVSRGRSQLASDTCHQVSPRAVPSSERQEQSSGRLRTASIARVFPLYRFHVRPPCRVPGRLLAIEPGNCRAWGPRYTLGPVRSVSEPTIQSDSSISSSTKTVGSIGYSRQWCRQNVGNPSARPVTILATGEDATATTTTGPGAGPGNRNGSVVLLLLLLLHVGDHVHQHRASRRRQCHRGWITEFHVAERGSWTSRSTTRCPPESRPASTWTCRRRGAQSPGIGDLLDSSSSSRQQHRTGR